MGLEQSSFSDFHKLRKKVSKTETTSSGSLSPLSEEMPHTSYLTGNPISQGLSIIPSASIPSSKSINFPHIKDLKNEDNKMLKSFPEQITIVSLGNKEKFIEDDYFIQKLLTIPLEYPIIHSLKFPLTKIKEKSQKQELISKSFSKNVYTMCQIYQEHCKNTKIPVLTAQQNLKQNFISIDKKIEFLATNFVKYNQTLEDICNIFNDPHISLLFDTSLYVKINSDFDRLIQIIQDLNSKLPIETRLQNITLDSSES